MKTARPIELSSEQRIKLEAMARSQTLEVRAVRRAQIVLLAADGMGNREIAAALGIGGCRWDAGASALFGAASRR
ncbi:DNA-binding NarL/FixJ family response regulator [Paraburkholderia sp. UCT70]